MKKIISILIAIIIIIYLVVEFVGDNIIKGSLESNLSNSLGRDITIDGLSIGYLSGKAEIENLQVKNKDFPGKLLTINNAFAKLNTSSIFSNKIEIDQITLDGINLNYYFNVNKSLKVNDNVKSLKENLNKGSSSSSSKEFIIKKLDVKNIKISANSEKLNINQQISLKDMSFENIGNTKDSKDYKTVLKDTFDKAFKSVKNKVLSGNVGNTLDKIKNIDEEKIKEKIKKELYENKDKVKDKLKKLLKKN
jgi:uncharacterized protein involved in outer membrane biogenesis